MNCLICRKADTIAGFTSVRFLRGEVRLDYDRVPAQVCPECGEAYLEEAVAVRLLNKAQVIAEEGIIEGVGVYS